MDPVVLPGSQSPFFFKMEACGPGKSACVMPSSVELEIKLSDFGKANDLHLLKNEVHGARSV
jgi:hypothetical protein